MLNKTDSSIPRAFSDGTRVNLTDKNNVKTTKCQIEEPILHKFEMVEINFEYKNKKGNQTIIGTAYVAQEFLRPAKTK